VPDEVQADLMFRLFQCFKLPKYSEELTLWQCQAHLYLAHNLRILRF